MTIEISGSRDNSKDEFDISGIKRSEMNTLIEALEDRVADKKLWDRKPYSKLLSQFYVSMESGV